MQPTHTAAGVDLSGIAKAACFALTNTVRTAAELERSIPPLYETPGPVFLNVKVSSKRYPMSMRLRDGVHIKNRFRENLLGQKAFD
jgi:hypothetical protein